MTRAREELSDMKRYEVALRRVAESEHGHRCPEWYEEDSPCTCHVAIARAELERK